MVKLFYSNIQSIEMNYKSMVVINLIMNIYIGTRIYIILQFQQTICPLMKMCYVIYNYIQILKKLLVKIAKGRQHWFHYGKREGRKIKFDESEKMRLLNKNLKKEWKVIINKDNKSNPVHILSKRDVIKDYFMFIHKIENKYIVKLERKQEFKKDKASQFILNKQEKRL